MSERILLTGGSGMFGTVLRARSHLHRVEFVAPTSKELDVTNIRQCLTYAKGIRVGGIVHAAAMTNWEACDADHEAAYAVNAIGALHMARIAEELKVPLVHISTDGVFSGEKLPTPITEEQRPGYVMPPHVYGKTKLMGEVFAGETNPNNLIVRLGWLFGNTDPKKDTKFVGAILRQLKAGSTTIKAVGDKSGSPTFAADAADTIFKFIDQSTRGMRHVINSSDNGATRYDVAVEACSLWAPRAEVLSVSSDEFPSPVIRPDYSVMGTVFEDSRLRHWKEAMASYHEEFPDVNLF